jgi:hypothetical protein
VATIPPTVAAIPTTRYREMVGREVVALMSAACRWSPTNASGSTSAPAPEGDPADAKGH